MQRNILTLVASKDLINWEIVDTILIDRTMLNFDVSMAIHAFQYVDWCFDGEDIIFTVRETMGDTYYFHNGYELTFYRLSNYKSLLDYTPPVEEDPVDTSTETESEDVSGGEENPKGIIDWIKENAPVIGTIVGTLGIGGIIGIGVVGVIIAGGIIAVIILVISKKKQKKIN